MTPALLLQWQRGAIRWHYKKEVSFVNFIFNHNISLPTQCPLAVDPFMFILCFFHLFQGSDWPPSSSLLLLSSQVISPPLSLQCARYCLAASMERLILKYRCSGNEDYFLKPDKQEMLFLKIRVEKGLCGVFSEWNRVSQHSGPSIREETSTLAWSNPSPGA